MLELERGRAEAQHRDDQNRRDAAEEVRVRDPERAQREEHRPRETSQHGEQEREHKDEGLCDREDLHVEQEGARDLGQRRLELTQSKNVRRTPGQPGACVIATPSSVKKITVLTSEIATARLPSPPLTLPRILERRVSFSVALLQHRGAGDLGQPFVL